MDKNFLLLKLNRVVWVAFLEQEKIEEAIRYFEMYIANFQSLLKHPQLKKLAQEEILFSTGLFLNKITELADEYYKDEDWPNAVICYAAYFKYNQEDISSNKKFIETLDKLDLFDLEIDLITYLETLNIKHPGMYKTIAELYSKKKDNSKAIEYLEKYMSASTEELTASDYNLLGCYYNLLFSDDTLEIKDAQSGLEAFAKASDMSPCVKLYAKNATIMAGKVGNISAGRKYWDRVLKIGGLSNDDKYDYAAYCLKTKDFEGWYKYFDSRFDKENNATRFPKISKTRYKGTQDLSKSTLLVYYEQGFGDSFLMYGYIPRLVKIAKHVIFVVQDNIYPLIKDNEYGIEVIPSSFAGDLKEIKFDYYIPSMSVPIVLKLNEKDISVGEGYIKADKKLVEEYKHKYFNNDKFKIGLSVSGNLNGDKTRDISVEHLLCLDKLKNVELYCITKGLPDSAFKEFKNNKVNNLGNKFEDFAQTAAAIENLDLVLTTDNVLLNLAGALGKKTFALFNNPNQFRWFDLSGENVVYLTSVKPFVNKEFNVWSSSVDKAVEEINKLI